MAELGNLDLSNSTKEAGEEISAVNAFIQSLRANKDLEKSQTNPITQSLNQTTTQLNKINKQQKRFLRKVPTSMSALNDLIGLTRGTGGPSKKAMRNLILRSAVQSESEVKKIIAEEALKSLGCSQEQIYKANTPISAQNIDLLPANSTIFIPVQSLDAITLANGMLKQNIDQPIGKILYESYPPTVADNIMRPYGGVVPFPFNRTLSGLMNNNNRSFFEENGKFYQGSSGQKLFNIQYTTTNEFGVTGNYYRVALVDREGIASEVNKVGTFLEDYYSTIKLFDTTELVPQVLNFISQFMNMKIPASSGPIDSQSKFYTLLSRILGLCFDSKEEIDVSGLSKVAELDGVDDEFFEFTEQDLRQIENEVNNVQNGVVEFADCENVKLPVDFNNLTNQCLDFKNTVSGQTFEEQIATMENIIDSLSENPDWKIYLPASFNAEATISEGIIKNMAIAVACAALSPKVLLPIFILLSVVESEKNLSYNQAVTPINQVNTAGTNIVTDSVDFIKKFTSFVIKVVSRIGGIFIKVLFETLKRELVNLIKIVVNEIVANKLKDSTAQTKALVQAGIDIAAQITQGIFDYKKCKSLVDEIKNIINIIRKLPGKRRKIPLPLAILSDFLPGESAEGAFINTIGYLQKIGLPTDALPDGTPNLMLLYNYATHRGRRQNQIQQGVNDTYCFNGFCWSVPR